MELAEGCVVSPVGFKAAGVACGLKPEGRDLALIVSDRPASAAGMFTTNRVTAAPIRVNRAHLQDGQAQAIVANSKNANACTGDQGLLDARRMARASADVLGLAPERVLVNSTGVIGVPMPMHKIASGLPEAAAQLRDDGWEDAAEAIMTTDTTPKMATLQMACAGQRLTLCGIAKGAGMIAPNMATMLAFLATDATLSSTDLLAGLRRAVGKSFNCITVDGDMSTNDTVLILANGAGEKLAGKQRQAFQQGLDALCISLAKQIARDGEGATKLIAVRVVGARRDDDARKIGLSVANSSLVKTAVFGNDPNWGRILCAVGYAGVPIDEGSISVSVAGIPIFARGQGLHFDDGAAVDALSKREVEIRIDIGQGAESADIYTCDLTYDYVRINAEYTT